MCASAENNSDERLFFKSPETYKKFIGYIEGIWIIDEKEIK